MRRFFACLGVITMLVVTAVTVAGASPSTSKPSAARSVPRDSLRVAPHEATVLLYGDSLASEAEDHFRDTLIAAGVSNVGTDTFGGTAICDYLDRMRVDATALRPTAVVVEFSGNALTPCMMDAQGQSLVLSPPDYHQKYADDAREVLEIFAATGTRVYFASAPKSRQAEETYDPDAGWLNNLYAGYALQSPNARYIGAGSALLRDGRWTETLPCLASEPCTGGIDADGRAINVVRAPDGGHFCPGAPDATRGVTDDCPVWSSGAFRYGRAMATAVVRDLDATDASAV